jgi:hypothetical protein
MFRSLNQWSGFANLGRMNSVQIKAGIENGARKYERKLSFQILIIYFSNSKKNLLVNYF